MPWFSGHWRVSGLQPVALLKSALPSFLDKLSLLDGDRGILAKPVTGTGRSLTLGNH